uniref:Uncharacterized protein n=1 Tax=Cajanus cajan TaxID=3821 RepID=A0A151U4Q7_CAJCA|nr:hypothetical protein KK1_006948 [Cajanus cajan]
MVQPQNKKKKQSMETRATDSNAVTTPHRNSSTMETLIIPDHLNNRRGDHRGLMNDANVCGHVESSHIAQPNVHPISLTCKGE